MARKTPVWQREAAARGYDSTGFYALLKAVDSNHKASPDALRNALVTRIIRKGTKERLGEDPVTGALTFTKKKGEKAADSKAYELVLMLRRVLEDQQRDLKQAQEAAPVALQSLIRKLVNSDSPEDRAWAEQEFLPAYKGNPVLRRLLLHFCTDVFIREMKFHDLLCCLALAPAAAGEAEGAACPCCSCGRGRVPGGGVPSRRVARPSAEQEET